ncbi:MAG: PP2C family protein-serine/threonine phosphatase [Acidobacteriota bacterium]
MSGKTTQDPAGPIPEAAALDDLPSGSVNVSDFRALISKVEAVLDSIEGAESSLPTVQKLVEGLTVALGAEMGIHGGRLYVHDEDDEEYLIWSSFGGAAPVERGHSVPADYPPIRSCLEQGVVYMKQDDPLLDREYEDSIGVGIFAAASISDGDFLIAVDLEPDHRRDDILFTLGLLRHGINDRLRLDRIRGVLRQARLIQTSILPRSAPDFPPYQLAARNRMLKSVGGDFFDWIPLNEKIVGVALADVAGHGLPAALQVRDIHMGLRMGIGADFKIVRTIERLNEIIHRSTLTSRFVAMFYGELENDGTFIFVNAGHHPPLYCKADGTVRHLTEGGSILGPIPGASYTRGYLTMRPGDVIVGATDGLLERARGQGDDREEFGVERMEAVLRENRRGTAEEILDAVFDATDAFAEGQSPTDDRTVLVIKYPEA